jgi:DNA-binding transcriptional LysR family regulator
MLEELWPHHVDGPNVVFDSKNTESLLAWVKLGHVAILPSDSLNNLDPQLISVHPMKDERATGEHAMFWRSDNSELVTPVLKSLLDVALAADFEDGSGPVAA